MNSPAFFLSLVKTAQIWQAASKTSKYLPRFAQEAVKMEEAVIHPLQKSIVKHRAFNVFKGGFQ